MASQCIITILLIPFSLLYAEARNISLPQKDARIIDVPVNGSVVIQPVGLSADVAYIQCQAHTQAGNITLSMKYEIEHDTAVTGRDVGVISMYSGTSDIKWYLYSHTDTDLQVLVHLTYFSEKDPFVGGCNEEFNLENDPNIHLHVHPTKTKVEFQWSNTGVNPVTGKYPSCEDSVFQSDIEYHTYVKFMEADDFSEDEYFNVIKQMLTVEDVYKHGTWLNKFSNTQSHKSFVDVSSYSHRGVVYNTMVKFNKDDVHTRAVYIPVVSYRCDIEHTDICKQRDVTSLVLSTAGGLIGLFLCFFGHRFFKTENFVFGFLIFGLIWYQVLTLATYISFLGTLALAAVFGLMGGTLLLGLWWYHGIPVINVLFIGLVTGYLVSSVLFYTPFGNLTYLETPFNYGATFACGVLVIPVILLFFTRFLSIFSCAVVGSYTFMLMFDMYIQSALHAIVLNSLRHGTDRSYVKVIVTGPFTHYEIALTVAWLVLLILGTGFQLFRERKKAPFPPCPRQLRDRAKDMRRLLQSHSKQTSPEREPLLRGGNHGLYGATQNAPVHVEETESSEEESYRPGMI
ncbi:transmembrane 7 superfamily member 3-like [Mercenaria mercenaria]|uniref:transmembrane 7 superfamily member 3-like n=1 Tax=Mercenaria mercenaria TaxID=6596 RepID=UPI00234E806D|nr:transmembrane 7 superfamily member 3-like [Mercenaria mercenaria]